MHNEEGVASHSVMEESGAIWQEPEEDEILWIGS